MLRNEGRHADPPAARNLWPLLRDPSNAVRLRAVEALGKIGQGTDALEIIRSLGNPSYAGTPAQRVFLGHVITALMRLDSTAARSLFEWLARTGDPELQWRVANAIYRMRDRGARSILLDLLRSPNPEVKAHAARALGICGDPDLAMVLAPLIVPADPASGRDLPLSVRVSALQALVNLEAVSAAPAIEAALGAAPILSSNPDQVNFAVLAASALGSLKATQSIGTLQTLTSIAGPVADSAVVAMARLLREDPEQFYRRVSKARFDTPARLRSWAAALGELTGERAERELRDMLNHSGGDTPATENFLALPSILRGLARHRPPDLQAILARYLAFHDGATVRAALSAFQPVAGDAAPWAPFLHAYAEGALEPDLETRVALIDRLEPWVNAAEVRSLLRTALGDRQRNVRIAAGRLLRSGGATDVPDDPGISATQATDFTYVRAASTRRDRTIAILETVRGNIEIELFREDAPLTVANFTSLAQRGFYDGLTFMRVVPYFVIQGGDPRNDQEGGPGYAIRCEINMRPFLRGSVGMALAGKDTGGSQFFISLSPQPHLDGGYTCFGQVIGGMSVAERMVAGDRISRVRIREEVSFLDYRDW